MTNVFASASAHPADAFIGSTLNIFNANINGYPVSFIVWNILLAIAAVIIGRWVAMIWSGKKNWLLRLLSLLAWLAILPNAAYLMTDARHVIGYCPLGSYGRVCSQNAWMTLFFFSYAALGWPAFVWALKPMKQLFAKRFGRIMGFVFAAFMSLICGLGVMLGLLNRFNSWEIVTRPIIIFQSVVPYLTNPIYLRDWLLASLFLFILYLLGERIFKDYGLFKSK